MKVMLVDDHVLFREGLENLLGTDPTFQVVAQAGSAGEAVEKAKIHKPGMVLMDFSLPDGDGDQAASAIIKEIPDCRIVFLTMHDADEKLFAAIRSGAKGYLLKNTPVAQLLLALHSVEKGEAALSRCMTMRVLDEFSHAHTAGGQVSAADEILSLREREILQALKRGASNQEIATTFMLSINTVKHHVHSILTKLGVDNRREAILYAQKNKMI